MPNFGELKAEIAQKMTRNDLTSEIGTALNRTLEFEQNTHYWFNERTATIPLTQGSPLISGIPSDFLLEVYDSGLVINYSNMRYVLKKVDTGTYDRLNVQGSGLPYAYTYRADNFYVYFYPDQAYNLELLYLKKYDQLVNDSDSNDFTNYATRLLVAQTLADLYIDQRESQELYGAYQLIAEQERSRLQQKNASKIATGHLITDNIVDRGETYATYGW